MAALIDAISIKRKMVFEHESAPYYCLDVELTTPTARGGQTLVRLKMRNLLTNAVFEKSEERRVGKSVDLGGRRIIKKKKQPQDAQTEGLIKTKSKLSPRLGTQQSS